MLDRNRVVYKEDQLLFQKDICGPLGAKSYTGFAQQRHRWNHELFPLYLG